MSAVATAIGVGALVTAGAGVAGALISADASNRAQKSQERIAQQQLEEQRAANAAALQQQSPYAEVGMTGVGGLQGYQEAGTAALAQQRALAGLDGPQAQAAAIAQLEASPQFQALAQQSEEAILANASATGGLRGGNVQGALAQNRQILLSSLIEQQMQRLGGLAGAGQAAAGGIASLGQAAAAGQAATGLTSSQLTGQILQGIGASRAGGIMAQGAAMQQGVGAIGQAAGGASGQFLGLRAAGIDPLTGRSIPTPAAPTGVL